MRVVLKREALPILLDSTDQEILTVSSFLRGLSARGCSPNTAQAYAYDLRRFYEYLEANRLTPNDVSRSKALAYIVQLAESQPKKANELPEEVKPTLAASSVNRNLAAVSTYFDHLILTEAVELASNPFHSGGSRSGTGFRRGMRDMARVKRSQHLPRPLAEEQGDCRER